MLLVFSLLHVLKPFIFNTGSTIVNELFLFTQVLTDYHYVFSIDLFQNQNKDEAIQHIVI